jgi:hypothetical protein
MASGRLATKVIVPYDTDPVYSVPNGISKTAFSLIVQGFNEADVSGTVIYKGNDNTSVYDTTSPSALNSFATAQTLYNLDEFVDPLLYGIPSEVLVAAKDLGYETYEVAPFAVAAGNSVRYLTYDQKYAWDSTNSLWRSADTEYGSSAVYVTAPNSYTTFSSNDVIFLLIASSNTNSASNIYPVDQTTFSRSGYGRWLSSNGSLTGDRIGRAANNHYAIPSTGQLATIRYDGNYYINSAVPFSGANVSTGWTLRDNQVGNSDDVTLFRSESSAIRIQPSVGYAISISSGMSNSIDTAWSWTSGGTLSNNFDLNQYENWVAYCARDSTSGIVLIEPNSSNTTFEYSVGSSAAAPSGSSMPNILWVCDRSNVPQFFTVATGAGTIFVSNTVGTNFSMSEFVSTDINTSLYSDYNSETVYSPTLSAGLASDAFDNTSWLYLANNTAITTTLKFNNPTDTYYDSIGGTIDLSNGIDVSITANNSGIVPGDYIVDSLRGTSPELKTGYIAIANSSVSESFVGSTIEITGRMISANDSIIIYTDVPTKVTVMGIEEE